MQLRKKLEKVEENCMHAIIFVWKSKANLNLKISLNDFQASEILKIN